MYDVGMLRAKMGIPADCQVLVRETVMRFITVSVILAGLQIYDPNRTAAQNPPDRGSTKKVAVGAFVVSVPTQWTAFGASEAATFRNGYVAQSKQVYQQYNGSREGQPQSVAFAAFHIAGDDGAFVLASFAVPPQANLIKLLKSQVKDKMDFGVRQGYIQKYLGLVPVDDEQLSGFYTTAIGKDGNVQVAGGLEHKKLKNTVIQLTLLCPKSWAQVRAQATLTAILKSVSLKQ